MRVAINCQILTVNRLGVGRYLATLLHALSATDGENEYVLLANPGIRDLLPARPNFEIASTSFPIRNTPSRIVWEQVFLPMELRKYGVDLVHFPDQSLPLLPILPCASVVTVHDLTTYRYTEAFTRGKVVYKKLTTRAAMRRAARLIADSQNTKQDILELFGATEKRVRVIYPGLNERFHPVQDRARLEQTREVLGLPQQYVLHVGSLDPRKNVVTLLKALAILRDEGLRKNLVVVGSKEYNYQPIFDTVHHLDLDDQVQFLGFVSDPQLVAVYNLAQLFVFPSIHEGFGFPPLEAMACGTPVIASNASSLPEIVGDAGLQVDPLDAAGLAAAIRLLLTDPELGKQLVCRGKQRAATFTWKRTAQETIEVYKQVAGSV